MFLNSLEQLMRRKILIVALIAALAFVGLFWLAVHKSTGSVQFGQGGAPGEAEAAMIAMFSAAAVASTLLTALAILLSVSILPDEISEGRMSFWAALPYSRLRIYIGTTLPALACSCALALLVFGGILGITRGYLRFSPVSPAIGLVSACLWLGVIWALVTTLSLIISKIPAMLGAFGLCGLAGFSGGFLQLGELAPEVRNHTFTQIAAIFRFVFPSDMAFRGLLFGIMPADSPFTEGLAFVGLGKAPALWELAYPLAWIAVVLGVGYLIFERKDLP